MTVVVGTAGHIDHGKTALLKALTGTDADRLPEEQRRGLTIDIGYAHGSPDGGPELDFVDVPGHDRLVGNMLVGVGEIDAALLVVAADDGPRPQTWEHLGLLDAMAVRDGVVAVTKADLVAPERAREVADGLLEPLGASGLAGAPIAIVASPGGTGLAALREHLARLRDRVGARPRRHQDRRWLALDRAFSVHGHGTVVTGTSRGADIAVGDELRLLPGDRRVRVRSVQVHDAAVEVAGTGRVALNLAGVDVGGSRRGQLLTDPSTGGPTEPFESRRLFVALRRPVLLPGARAHDWPPRDGTELRLHIGTAQADARVGRGGRLGSLTDGSELAVLHLAHPVATAVGERFVLRRPPPAGLLAGGLVLGRDAPRGRARSRLDAEAVQALVAALEGGSEREATDALVALHGSVGAAMAHDLRRLARSTLAAAVHEHHRAHPAEPGLPLTAARSAITATIRGRLSSDTRRLRPMADDTIDAAVEAGELVRDGDLLRAPGHHGAAPDPAVVSSQERLLAALDVSAPPPLSEAARAAGCPPAAVAQLERDGRIVVVGDDLAWTAAAHRRLGDLALALAAEAPLTPAALRDRTATSRKYVMALLEDLDRRGILMRTPAGHVPGPRAQERR